MIKVTEGTLVSTVREYFTRRYVGRLYEEVPFLGRSADLVCCSENLVACEVKVGSWKKAFEQAFYHVLIADYTWIAVSSKSVPPPLLERARERGIGIIQLSRDGEKFAVITEPMKSKLIFNPERRLVNRYLEEWK